MEGDADLVAIYPRERATSIGQPGGRKQQEEFREVQSGDRRVRGQHRTRGTRRASRLSEIHGDDRHSTYPTPTCPASSRRALSSFFLGLTILSRICSEVAWKEETPLLAKSNAS